MDGTERAGVACRNGSRAFKWLEWSISFETDWRPGNRLCAERLDAPPSNIFVDPGGPLRCSLAHSVASGAPRTSKVIRFCALSRRVRFKIQDITPTLPRICYDGYIMMSRTQVTLDQEMQRRARQRASELGVSLAEYFRRLVARDLGRPEKACEVDRIFDLGNSGGSDVAKDKDQMTAEAVHSRRRSRR